MPPGVRSPPLHGVVGAGISQTGFVDKQPRAAARMYTVNTRLRPPPGPPPMPGPPTARNPPDLPDLAGTVGLCRPCADSTGATGSTARFTPRAGAIPASRQAPTNLIAPYRPSRSVRARELRPSATAWSTSWRGLDAPYRSEYPEATCRCVKRCGISWSFATRQGQREHLLVGQAERGLDQMVESFGVAQQVVRLGGADHPGAAGVDRGAAGGGGGEV